MKKFKEYIKNKDDKKQKIDMYFDYYKNLSPKNFKVKKEKNKIVIELLWYFRLFSAKNSNQLNMN